MIIRIETCPECGEEVYILLPELFPDLTSQKLEKFKQLCLDDPKKYCKNCKEKRR